MPKTDSELVSLLRANRTIADRQLWFDAGVVWSDGWYYWTDAWAAAMDLSDLFKAMVIALDNREYAIARFQFMQGYKWARTRRGER